MVNPAPSVPYFDWYQKEQQDRQVREAQQNINGWVTSEIPNLSYRVDTLERTMGAFQMNQKLEDQRLQFLLTAIRTDLAAIEKHCPHVLAAAAGMAMEDMDTGGEDGK